MLYPVEAHTGGSYLPTPRTVATFFTWSAAANFIEQQRGDGCNLYFGDPLYDRRQRGYRPAPVDSGYAAWCAQVDERRARIVEPEVIVNRATGRAAVMV